MCHSNLPRAPLPSLTRMSQGAHDAFDQIVLEGLLLPNGMPRWDDVLKPDEVKAIHAYLIDLQTKAHASEARGEKAAKPVYTRVTPRPQTF
jgi:quinohemoprotein ethanol dehydrogenase